MTTTTHPSKDSVHSYMQRRVEQQRTKEHLPPPTPEEIRRQLGWRMVQDEDRGR